MHLILTGATGLVGSSVLAHVISTAGSNTASRKVTHLSILSRNPSIPYLQKHPLPADSSLKIDVIQHSDFESYPPELLSRLKGADGVVWALGISQNEVKTDEEYIKITKTFALKAAEAFKEIPEKGAGSGDGVFKFVYVSGEGATHTPGRFTPIFGRVKGQTEMALLELAKANPAFRAYNARPGGVDPKDQPELAEVLLPKVLNSVTKKLLYHIALPPLRILAKNMMSPTKELGQALTDLAIGDGQPISGPGVENDGWTLSCVTLRKLAGL